jgi:hypothetical protein
MILSPGVTVMLSVQHVTINYLPWKLENTMNYNMNKLTKMIIFYLRLLKVHDFTFVSLCSDKTSTVI